MAAPFSLILRKLENAAVAYLNAQSILVNGVPVTVVPGKASLIKVAPLVVVYAERSKEEPPFSGNHFVTIHTIVKFPLGTDSNAVSQVPDSDALTAAVCDAMLPGGPGDDHSLADALTAAAVVAQIADFTALNNQTVSMEASADEGQVWVETLTQTIYCCALGGD